MTQIAQLAVLSLFFFPETWKVGQFVQLYTTSSNYFELQLLVTIQTYHTFPIQHRKLPPEITSEQTSLAGLLQFSAAYILRGKKNLVKRFSVLPLLFKNTNYLYSKILLIPRSSKRARKIYNKKKKKNRKIKEK